MEEKEAQIVGIPSRLLQNGSGASSPAHRFCTEELRVRSLACACFTGLLNEKQITVGISLAERAAEMPAFAESPRAGGWFHGQWCVVVPGTCIRQGSAGQGARIIGGLTVRYASLLCPSSICFQAREGDSRGEGTGPRERRVRVT